MKKTLFTAALACALSIFGLVASAQSSPVTFDAENNQFSSNVSKNLSLLVATSADVDLSGNLSTVATEAKTFGYKKNGTFVSLAQAVNDAQVATVGNANVTSISLGNFKEDDTMQFGYRDSNNEFHPYSPFKIESDPGYYAGYNADSFYGLDFTEDPFNGMIEIHVIGEPLPAPAVTLIVALAAGALFLLYKNRGRRSIRTEQA